MPKDAKKNIDRYKIRGGELNEYEFRQNQALVKESTMPGWPTAPGQAMGNEEPAKPLKGATAQQSDVKQLVAKKSAANKVAAKKTGANKSAAKKSGTKKAAAKKSATKKSAGKKSAKRSAKK